MSRVVRLLAFVLAFALFPGATEIVENVSHLVSSGHTAHAVDDSDHAPQGDEHGCSGTTHVCACHGSIPFLVSDEGVVLSAAMVVKASLHGEATSSLRAGHSLGVYRPPSA